RLLCFQRTNQRFPGARFLERHGRVDIRQAGLVGEQPPDRDLLLTSRAELRPVPHDRSVEIELATLDEEVGAHCGRTLRGRRDERDRVPSPRAILLAVGQTTPQIDHSTPVDIDAACSAEVLSFLEVGTEGVRHRLPAVFDQAIDVTHCLASFILLRMTSAAAAGSAGTAHGALARRDRWCWSAVSNKCI